MKKFVKGLLATAAVVAGLAACSPASQQSSGGGNSDSAKEKVFYLSGHLTGTGERWRWISALYAFPYTINGRFKI